MPIGFFMQTLTLTCCCNLIQWNLYITDTLGPLKLSFIQRCPLFRGKIIHNSMGQKKVSFIERCPLFGVSFIRGSTVSIHVILHIKRVGHIM